VSRTRFSSSPGPRLRRFAAAAILATALAVPLIACGGADGPGATSGGAPTASAGPDFAALRAGQKFNVVLVTLDTTRADHIGAYGSTRVETPAIDALAQGGVLFRSAYSPVPLTLPAHVSLMTGLYPFDHGVRDNTGFALPAGLTTLAELLHEDGFRTGAFVASYVLAAHWGLARGFDTYDDGLTSGARRTAVIAEAQRPANQVIDDALAWIDDAAATTPFFLWVHLYDPHTPYAPPEPYNTRYADDLYAGEVAFADAQLARLMERLRRDGTADHTFVVIAADHGESLGDHGEREHGFFVYEPAIRVPLIVATPFPEIQGVSSDAVVSLVDIMPTVLEMSGLATPQDVDGRSLVPLFGGEKVADRSVYAETYYPRLHYGWSELTAVYDGRYKLILSSEPELYVLADDPTETINRFRELAEARDRLEEEAELMLSTAHAPDARVTVDASARRTLEALGYIATPAASGGDDSRRPAPLSRIGTFNKSLQARSLMGQGRLDEAARLYEEILDDDPEVLIAYQRLGAIYMLQGRYEEAEQTLSYAVPLRPDWFDLYVKLANAQVALGALDRAEATLRASLELTSPNPDTHCLLGFISERRRALPDALQEYRECNRLGPDLPDPLVSLARVHLRMGDTAAATTRVREALALDEGAVGAHYILGQIAAAAGQAQRAIDEYLAEIANDPANVDAHFGLAMLYGEAGRSADERQHLEAVLRAQPEHPLAALFLGNLLLQSDQDLQRAVDLVTAAVDKPLERQDLAAGYFILSNLHERLGNVALAREYLQRAQSLRKR